MPIAANSIVLKPQHHRRQDGIGLYFPYEESLIALAKGLEGARWSKTNGCWYLPGDRVQVKVINFLKLHVEKVNFINYE